MYLCRCQHTWLILWCFVSKNKTEQKNISSTFVWSPTAQKNRHTSLQKPTWHMGKNKKTQPWINIKMYLSYLHKKNGCCFFKSSWFYCPVKSFQNRPLKVCQVIRAKMITVAGLKRAISLRASESASKFGRSQWEKKLFDFPEGCCQKKWYPKMDSL